jgi:uncharacterized protein (DUF488 family)
LTGAGVDVFCDVRARRGVRGPAYAFANSERLQARLADLGIRYIHRKDLAPDAETRALQSAADHAGHIRRRERRTLTPAFVESYRRERLDGFDPVAFLADLGPDASTVALFCVEGYPEACHRSLLADRLASATRAKVIHLLPH